MSRVRVVSGGRAVPDLIPPAPREVLELLRVYDPQADPAPAAPPLPPRTGAVGAGDGPRRSAPGRSAILSTIAVGIAAVALVVAVAGGGRGEAGALVVRCELPAGSMTPTATPVPASQLPRGSATPEPVDGPAPTAGGAP